jgi:tRNA pseudouridine13 synthase
LREKLAKWEAKERNPRVKKLLINAYQSYLFNLWLSRRLEINTLVNSFDASEIEDLLNLPNDEITKMKAQKHPFKLISGDIMEHYPYGKLFEFEAQDEDLERFNNRDISVTGLLCGSKVKLSSSLARDVEKNFDDTILADGARRFAWIYQQI